MMIFGNINHRGHYQHLHFPGACQCGGAPRPPGRVRGWDDAGRRHDGRHRRRHHGGRRHGDPAGKRGRRHDDDARRRKEGRDARRAPRRCRTRRRRPAGEHARPVGGTIPEPGYLRRDAGRHRQRRHAVAGWLDPRPDGAAGHPDELGPRADIADGLVQCAAQSHQRGAARPAVRTARCGVMAVVRLQSGPVAQARGLCALPDHGGVDGRAVGQRLPERVARGRLPGCPRKECLRQFPQSAQGRRAEPGDGHVPVAPREREGPVRYGWRDSAAPAGRELCARSHAIVLDRTGPAQHRRQPQKRPRMEATPRPIRPPT